VYFRTVALTGSGFLGKLASVELLLLIVYVRVLKQTHASE
jgi:hypothetical protein